MKDNQLKADEAFNAFAETVFESNILSEREKALISLASWNYEE